MEPAFTVEETGLLLSKNRRLLPWDSILAAGTALVDPTVTKLNDAALRERLARGDLSRLLLVQYRPKQRAVLATLPAEGDLASLAARLGNRWLQPDDLPYAERRGQLRPSGRRPDGWSAALSMLGMLGSCLLAVAVPVLAGGLVEIGLDFAFARFGWLLLTLAGLGVVLWGSSVVTSGAEERAEIGISRMLTGVVLILAGVIVAAGSLVVTFAPRFVARLQNPRGFGGALAVGGLLGLLWAASRLVASGSHGVEGARGVLTTGREILVGAVLLAGALAAMAAGAALAAGLVAPPS